MNYQLSEQLAFVSAGAHSIGIGEPADVAHAAVVTAPIPVTPGVPIELRVEVDEERLLFGYRVGADGWKRLPQVFDASILSDEASAPGQPNFTGAFVGMACQDVSGAARCADFSYFEYRERAYLERPL